MCGTRLRFQYSIHSRTDSQHATCICIVCRALRKSFCPLPPCTAPSQEAFIASKGEREDLLQKVATLGQLTHLAYDCPKKHRAADVLQAAGRIVKEAGLHPDCDLGRLQQVPFLLYSCVCQAGYSAAQSTRSTSGAVFDLLTKHLPRYNSKAWHAQGIGRDLKLTSLGRVLTEEHDVVLGAAAGEYAKQNQKRISELFSNYFRIAKSIYFRLFLNETSFFDFFRTWNTGAISTVIFATPAGFVATG